MKYRFGSICSFAWSTIQDGKVARLKSPPPRKKDEKKIWCDGQDVVHQPFPQLFSYSGGEDKLQVATNPTLHSAKRYTYIPP